MDLWIRSRDRAVLVNLKNIIKISLSYIDDSVIAYDITGTAIGLGKYSTEKRALEILDEIQKILQPCVLFGNVTGSYVYEMPEK